MKRYFSILAVAFAALLSTTSCQLESGTDPNPNRKNDLLWGQVNDAINQHYDHFRAVAHLNDTLLDKGYLDDVYKNCEVVENNGIYTLTYIANNYSYRIKTDGKRLDEGGIWTIYYRLSNYMEFAEVGKAVGVVGETSKFQLLIDNSEYGYTYYATSFVAESEMEYEYDEVKECLCVKYNTFKGYSSTQPVPSDYIIEFEVVEPLVVRASIEEGKVNILYKDLVENTNYATTVCIHNKIVTFAP